MPQLSIQSNVPLVRKGLEKLRAGMPTIGRRRLYDAAMEIKRRMQKPGKKITYPVHWDSLKQMRAFFATDGFGAGIPTERTGHYIQHWRVVRTETGYNVLNRSKAARYIAGYSDGSGQSKIHKDRWPLFRDVADFVITRLPKLVVSNLREFVKRVVSET